jgi:AraC-like DNA-binding protein
LLTDDLAQLDGVAKRLGMTGRSLQRRLKDEGTSFQETRDAVRRELADAYLGQGMSFAEISFLLGFAEPSAFFRAFKRWTGVTPLERRATLGMAWRAVSIDPEDCAGTGSDRVSSRMHLQIVTPA